MNLRELGNLLRKGRTVTYTAPKRNKPLKARNTGKKHGPKRNPWKRTRRPSDGVGVGY